MKCSVCNKEIVNELNMVLISCDGDFVCDEKCKKKWNDDMDAFYRDIAPYPEKFEAWMKSND